MRRTNSKPLRLVTDERLDVVAHRGWLDLDERSPLLEVGAAVEILSRDGRWGLVARVSRIEPVSHAAVRIVLDGRGGGLSARTPTGEGAD